MNTTTARTRRISAVLLFASLATDAFAQSTIGIQSASDNTLYESPTGSLSNGKGPSVFTGLTATGQKRRALLQFDVASALPAGSKILSATLTFEVMQSTVVFPAPGYLHRVLQSWGEGTSVASGGGGSGGVATTNDATWLHRFYPSSTWTNAGGDFAATPSVTLSVPSLGVGTSPASADANADVQSWLDNPAQNFGWVLLMDETLPSTARRINSREALSGTRPTLNITYLTPGSGATWGTGCPSGAGTFGTAFVGAPIGGSTISIAQTSATVNGIGANYFSLGFDPVGVPLGLPGCTVYLPLSQPLIPGSVFLTSGSGAASSPFQVPSGFPGYLVNCQAAVIDSNPMGFLVSNSAVICLQ